MLPFIPPARLLASFRPIRFRSRKTGRKTKPEDREKPVIYLQELSPEQYLVMVQDGSTTQVRSVEFIIKRKAETEISQMKLPSAPT